MKANKKVTLCGVMLMVSFLFLGYTAAFAIDAQQPQPRQKIVNSIYSCSYAGAVDTKNETTTVMIEDGVLIADMVKNANVGAVKNGDVGALWLTANTLDDHCFQIFIQGKALESLITSANRSEIYQLTISHPLGRVQFTNRAEIASLADGEIDYQLEKVNASDLTSYASQQIGNRPIRRLTLENNRQTITSAKGSLQLSIPYHAAKNEDKNQLVIYQIEDNGQLTPVINSLYKTITDETGNEQFVMQAMIEEPGIYAIGYHTVTANDISGWSQPYIHFVLAREIMNTNQQNQFLPNQFVTRADLARFLYNMSDCQSNFSYNNTFSDVSQEHPAANSIAWAYSAGIITGYSDGTFQPNRLVARQELAAMLHRYSQLVGDTYLPRTVALQPFQDHDKIASFAKNAISDLQQAGILNGRDNGCFAPQEYVTRAECAKMIYGLMYGIMEGKVSFVSFR